MSGSVTPKHIKHLLKQHQKTNSIRHIYSISILFSIYIHIHIVFFSLLLLKCLIKYGCGVISREVLFFKHSIKKLNPFSK